MEPCAQGSLLLVSDETNHVLDLTISIVNHKNRALLKPFLESIFALTHTVSFEIYVVDNASADGSVEMLLTSFPQVHLLCNNKPLGFAQNNNQVLEKGKGRYFVLLNDDMLLGNDALDRMVAFMDGNRGVGALGCKLVNADGTTQRSCWRGFPSPKTLLTDLFYLSKWLPWLPWVRDFEVTLSNTSDPIEVDYVLGACLMVRREILAQVGFLDEDYFMFLEETDWCYRIQKNGWRIFWLPDGEIIHFGQQSVSKDPVRFVPMLYRNYCQFCRKHGSRRMELTVLKVIIALGTLFRTILWAYRSLTDAPNSRAMLRGYLAALLAVPSY